MASPIAGSARAPSSQNPTQPRRADRARLSAYAAGAAMINATRAEPRLDCRLFSSGPMNEYSANRDRKLSSVGTNSHCGVGWLVTARGWNAVSTA